LPTRRLTVGLEGIGLLGPGLGNWLAGSAILAGRVGYVPQATVLPPCTALPTAERRRTGKAVKLALAIGQEAIASAGFDPSALPTVFSSSGGDGYNCHEICATLASGDRRISPTRFHNSVHNATAGYWGIATGALLPATVLCGFDASFGSGLLEAVASVVVDNTRSVLIAYDTDYPEPLRSCRPIFDAFGVALVLAPAGSKNALAEITVSLTGADPDRLADGHLESLRQAIPAARSLPLLQAIALGQRARVVIDYLAPLRLAVDIAPCGENQGDRRQLKECKGAEIEALRWSA
jgi:hypothetical protein